jgi:hypothetical protein
VNTDSGIEPGWVRCGGCGIWVMPQDLELDCRRHRELYRPPEPEPAEETEPDELPNWQDW